MRILVTGAAGFIGSHLCEELLKNPKYDVIGIDDFIGPTPFLLKIRNIKPLTSNGKFKLIKANLLEIDLNQLLKGIDIIYHLAAIPGVRTSWGTEFDPYVTNNILVTQKLLEAAKTLPIKKFIYASTSSVYGEKQGKVSEDQVTCPISPYGITKLTGENLCHVYYAHFQVPVIILRFFTVYGPRQRPDMAFHRFIKQILQGNSTTIFGDGKQSRDFTYIDDCIAGTMSVLLKNNIIGETFNIGGNERATVLEIISILEEISGKKADCQFLNKIAGDPSHTWADISKSEKILGYKPKTSLKEGLFKEYLNLKTFYEDDII